MKNCSCGGKAKLVGNFMTGNQIQCSKCKNHTRPMDKVGAIRSWEQREGGPK